LLDQARGAKPEVVRAMIAPPAIYRDGRYVLDARFLVWADDPSGATGLVEEVLAGAGVACRLVVPSGRSLSDAEVPRPRAARPAPAGKGKRPVAAKRPAARPGKTKAKATVKTTRRKPAAKPRRSPARRTRIVAKSARGRIKGRRPSAKKRSR
jgi:hypothetical protein